MEFLQLGTYKSQDFIEYINAATKRQHTALNKLVPFTSIVLGITKGLAYTITRGSDEIHVMMCPEYIEGNDAKFNPLSVRNFLTTEGFLKIGDHITGTAD